MADPFLAHRKQQEAQHLAKTSGSADPFSSLITVELNITELCNRKCVFCPRVDPEVYPNRNLHMEQSTVAKVAADLAAAGYQGRVSFSGFGEPFLNKKFSQFVRVCRKALPLNTIETNTNGDFLKVETIKEIFGAGLSFLYVNLYDNKEQRGRFDELMAQAGVDQSRYRLRDHWVGATQDFGLNLNNRSGMVDLHMEDSRSPADLVGAPCYYPFYKMLIDWDGNVLFCSNDWGRKIVVGNVLSQNVKDIWLSPEMRRVRQRLGSGDRSVAPCDGCNVVGTLHGKSSFELLTSFYATPAS
ncbi:MAG: SPASM domain-containing protein [Elusimicrobia bacterium]|nr:SPASM domain-containing protein [Elusimicrobiota bacterium]